MIGMIRHGTRGRAQRVDSGTYIFSTCAAAATTIDSNPDNYNATKRDDLCASSKSTRTDAG